MASRGPDRKLTPMQQERAALGARGRRLALLPQFRWSNIACQFDEALRRALGSLGTPGSFIVDKVQSQGPSGDMAYAGRG